MRKSLAIVAFILAILAITDLAVELYFQDEAVKISYDVGI